MKWFLSVCALAGLAAALSSFSCGPQKQFCPNHPPDFACFDNDGGGMGGTGGQDLGFCDGGTTYYCGPQNLKQCTPC